MTDHGESLRMEAWLRATESPDSPREGEFGELSDPSADSISLSGEKRWKAPRYGRCAICRRQGRIVRHHVVYQQHLRIYGGDLWDLRNALDVGLWCQCHANHHSATSRIRLPIIPDAAIEFAVEVLGASRAALYFARYYDCRQTDLQKDFQHILHKEDA